MAIKRRVISSDRLPATVEYLRIDEQLQRRILEAASRSLTDAKSNRRMSFVLVAFTPEGQVLLSESHQMRRLDV